MVRLSEPQGLAFNAVAMLPMYALMVAVAVKDMRHPRKACARRVVLVHGNMEHDVWFVMLATWSSGIRLPWDLRWSQLGCMVLGVGGCAALWYLTNGWAQPGSFKNLTKQNLQNKMRQAGSQRLLQANCCKVKNGVAQWTCW